MALAILPTTASVSSVSRLGPEYILRRKAPGGRRLGGAHRLGHRLTLCWGLGSIRWLDRYLVVCIDIVSGRFCNHGVGVITPPVDHLSPRLLTELAQHLCHGNEGPQIELHAPPMGAAQFQQGLSLPR